jgi:glyoxylase-like metal-dependent hydrolase (beta-lactamase superfamily II)
MRSSRPPSATESADPVVIAGERFAPEDRPQPPPAPSFELYALRYARRDAVRGEHFYGHDPHQGPMPMDYFVWLAVSGDVSVVVDAGFAAEVAARRGREYLLSPLEGLRRLGLEPAGVEDVVLTHLHYDHAGNLGGFPAATFHLQEEELGFWTGRHAGRGEFRELVEPEDVAQLVLANFARRVRFVADVAEIVPGVTVHRVGGHSAGLQVVRVRTSHGHAVLASDATHFYANLDEDRPYRIVHGLPAMYDAFDRVRELADGPELIVPGHDPLVMESFPAASPELEGVAVRVA